MSKVKNVKLGENANSFYDPVTGTKVLPGQVIEVDAKTARSTKIAVALRHGHLVIASEEDIEAANEGNLVTNNDSSNDVDTNWDEFEDYTEAGLKRLTKAKLVELAMHLESEYSQEELNEMNKQELAEEIMEIQEEKE